MIVGTAGHIDHGKTSLVRALTGVDTDRLKEEKQRGISIDLGFAYLKIDEGTSIGFVDVPGHEKFVHNMVAGATGIDFALLVVAADDGVMPQTREHLAIIDLLGVDRGIVALTKSDLVDPERRDAVANEIRATLASTGLHGAPILPLSTVTGEGLDQIRDALTEASHAIADRRTGGRFRLAVDRCFVLPGTGTVVTGTVLSGVVAVGDRVTISPAGLTARVRSLHAQNRVAQQGHAGQRCAIALVGDGIAKDAIIRGDMVVDPALHAPTDRVDVSLRVLPSEPKPFGQWTPVRLHHGATDVAARLVLLNGETIAPGAQDFVQLVLDRPIAAAAHDRFIVRDTTGQRTIGGGWFADLRAPARKRRGPQRLTQVAAYAERAADLALKALLEAEPFHVDLDAFIRDRALSEREAATLLSQCEVVSIAAPGTSVGLASRIATGLRRAVLGTVEVFHQEHPDLPGIGMERLRLNVEPRLPVAAFRSFLNTLADEGVVGLDGAWVRLPGHVVRLAPEDEEAWTGIEPLLRGEERFRPPRVRDIGGLIGLPEPDVRRVLKLLSRLGKVDEVANDHFFLRDTVAEMVEIIVRLAAEAPAGEFTAAMFRDEVNNGRKVAIQILEFYDRHGVTLRRGDLRRINRHRLDLFRRSVLAEQPVNGRESSPVGRPDFKSGRDRETVLGGFDSLSLPPAPQGPRSAGRAPP